MFLCNAAWCPAGTEASKTSQRKQKHTESLQYHFNIILLSTYAVIHIFSKVQSLIPHNSIDRHYHPHFTGKKIEAQKGDLMEITELVSGNATCGLDSLALGSAAGVCVCSEGLLLCLPPHLETERVPTHSLTIAPQKTLQRSRVIFGGMSHSP